MPEGTGLGAELENLARSASRLRLYLYREQCGEGNRD